MDTMLSTTYWTGLVNTSSASARLSAACCLNPPPPWGTKIGVRWESLGEKTEKYRERYRMKWVPNHTGSLNSASSKSRQMQVLSGIETPVEKWSLTTEVLRNNLSEPRTETQSIHQVSRSYWGWRPILDRSTTYWVAAGIAKKKKKKTEKAQQTTRYRGGVEPAFKASFSRWEKHKHEFNPTCNPTNNPINILSS